MSDPLSFRDRLCALRDAAGLLDADVSALCDLSESAAGHLFKGRRDFPRAETTIALCQLFGCSADYLLRGGEGPSVEAVRAAVANAMTCNPDVARRVDRRGHRNTDPHAIADEVVIDRGPEYAQPAPVTP